MLKDSVAPSSLYDPEWHLKEKNGSIHYEVIKERFNNEWVRVWWNRDIGAELEFVEDASTHWWEKFRRRRSVLFIFFLQPLIGTHHAMK